MFRVVHPDPHPGPHLPAMILTGLAFDLGSLLGNLATMIRPLAAPPPATGSSSTKSARQRQRATLGPTLDPPGHPCSRIMHPGCHSGGPQVAGLPSPGPSISASQTARVLNSTANPGLVPQFNSFQHGPLSSRALGPLDLHATSFKAQANTSHNSSWHSFHNALAPRLFWIISLLFLAKTWFFQSDFQRPCTATSDVHTSTFVFFDVQTIFSTPLL